MKKKSVMAVGFGLFLSTPKAVDLEMRKNIINLEKCKLHSQSPFFKILAQPLNRIVIFKMTTTR